MPTKVIAAGGLLLLLMLTASSHAEETMTLKLSSPAFGPNDSIPEKYTCEGEDLSPPLTWTGVPQGTRSLALIVDDPDAPDPAHPRMTWVHWVLFNISPETVALLEGAAKAPPSGGRHGLNDWKRTGYGGPCPPIGRHRYFHKLYALDIALDAALSPTKDELEKAMKGHILAQAELVGTYQKTR